MGSPLSFLHKTSPGKPITRPYYYPINLLSTQTVILQRQPAVLHFTFLDSLIGDERKKSNRAQENKVIHNLTPSKSKITNSLNIVFCDMLIIIQPDYIK